MIKKYFQKINKFIKRHNPFRLKPYLGEDYEDHWNFTDFKNKVILDLGADYGSTADWFLSKGATKVVAVESLNFPELAAWADGVKVIPVNLLIQTPADYERLITEYHPDVAKIDIEGWERPMLEADPLLIGSVKEYMIETHSKELFNLLTSFLTKLGYQVTHSRELGPETDVIFASRNTTR